MAEDEKKPDRFLDEFNGSLENAFQRLHEKGLDRATCPICRSTEWVVETRTDPESDQLDYNAPVFAMKDPRSFWGPAPAIPTLAFTCTSCGFLRQHNVAWLSQPSAKGDSDG